MSTTYPPPRRITPDSQPVAPCWCWNGRWNYWCAARPNVELYDYTHWVPVPAQPELPPPPESPEATCERELERLKGELDRKAQEGIELKRGRNEAESAWNSAQDEIRTLKGRLDSAEQHVKILTEQRDQANDHLRYAQDMLIRTGLASPRPAAPKAQKVHPWTREEVPLGAWFQRRKDASHRLALLGVHATSVTLAHGRQEHSDSAGVLHLPLERLAENWDHSTDGGKTWLPAGRVVYEGA